MPDLRTFTLWAREKLTGETRNQLEQIYRIHPQTGVPLDIPQGHVLKTSEEARLRRKRIETLLADEAEAGLSRPQAVAKLVKETAFTHLNRLVAFKLLEARKLVRGVLAKHHQANGFKMWLSERPEEEELYNLGDDPNLRDGFGEAPRDRAYRHFLLWQSAELAKEIRVLFDTDNVPTLLFPRPAVLKELIVALNDSEREADWEPGNEETFGWVYQYFNEPDLEVFRGRAAMQVPPELVGPRTQNYTPRWVVEFLVQNSLGRLWLGMHPSSRIRTKLGYLVPLSQASPPEPPRSVKDLRLLDPACGTMHFGLVAFDLLFDMYLEEMENAGYPGWPPAPPVRSPEDIPAAILANNLFGIDIDLRAVQLAALALYLRAKAANAKATLSDNNLACSDVRLFRGEHRGRIVRELNLPRGVGRHLFEEFCDALDDAAMMGSLVRMERQFQEKLAADKLKIAIDEYLERKAAEGIDESFFAGESKKGLRLLEVLLNRYDIVFTNPPYLDSRDYNPAMREFVNRNYPRSSRNLYSAMMERCLELTSPTGHLAIITGQSFMFISSFKDLRNAIADAGALECMAHFDYGLFRARVDTTAFVLRRESFEQARRDSVGVYFRLVKEPDAESKRAAFEQALERRRAGQPDPRVYEYRQGDFAAIPGSPWVYWITPGLRRTFQKLPKLSEIARPRQGMATADNTRFLRYWWEVGLRRIERRARNASEAERSGCRWFPYMKGGSFRRWYGNQEYVLNWADDGAELWAFTPKAVIRNPDFYFRRGVTWTALSAKGLSARLMPEGSIFGHKGPAVFGNDHRFELGLLNSRPVAGLLRITSPTIMFEVGQLANLPVPDKCSSFLSELVEQAIELARKDSEEDETTYDFIAPPPWPDGAQTVAERHRRLAAVEKEIDEEVYRLYEISPEDRKAIEEELAAAPVDPDADADGEAEAGEDSAPAEAPVITQEELARQWVSYAVGVALGRFAPGEPGGLGRGAFPEQVNAELRGRIDPDGVMVLQKGHPDDLAARVIHILAAIHGESEAERLIRTAAGGHGELRDRLEAYLLGPFFKAHVRQYRKRPVYWLLQSPKQRYSVYLFHERATDQTLALIQGNRYLGGRIFQLRQQLEDTSRRAEAASGREKTALKRRAAELAEELADLEAFDKAITETNSEPVVDAKGRPAQAKWVPELDDGVLLNAAPLYRLTPAWKKADAKLDPAKAWEALRKGEYPWARTAMRYWPRETLEACKQNRSYRIAHGLE